MADTASNSASERVASHRHRRRDRFDEVVPARDVRRNDVLFGRGTGINGYWGNVAFRNTVREYATEYVRSSGIRGKKTRIINSIIDNILKQNGRFLRKLDDDEIRSHERRKHQCDTSFTAVSASGRGDDDSTQERCLKESTSTVDVSTSAAGVKHPSQTCSSNVIDINGVYAVISDRPTLVLKAKQAFRHAIRTAAVNLLDPSKPAAHNSADGLSQRVKPQWQPRFVPPAPNTDKPSAAADSPVAATFTAPAAANNECTHSTGTDYSAQARQHNRTFSRVRQLQLPPSTSEQTAHCQSPTAASPLPANSATAQAQNDVLPPISDPHPTAAQTALSAQHSLENQPHEQKASRDTVSALQSNGVSNAANIDFGSAAVLPMDDEAIIHRDKNSNHEHVGNTVRRQEDPAQIALLQRLLQSVSPAGQAGQAEVCTDIRNLASAQTMQLLSLASVLTVMAITQQQSHQQQNRQPLSMQQRQHEDLHQAQRPRLITHNHARQWMPQQLPANNQQPCSATPTNQPVTQAALPVPSTALQLLLHSLSAGGSSSQVAVDNRNNNDGSFMQAQGPAAQPAISPETQPVRCAGPNGPNGYTEHAAAPVHAPPLAQGNGIDPSSNLAQNDSATQLLGKIMASLAQQSTNTAFTTTSAAPQPVSMPAVAPSSSSTLLAMPWSLSAELPTPNEIPSGVSEHQQVARSTDSMGANGTEQQWQTQPWQ